ncbi:hypothetical protein [Comamonas aquatica]|nr:hypothetical protein [Comamonas aquatica]
MLWSSNDVTQQGSRPKTKLEKFMDIKTAEDIGALQARCMILESRVAALAAFASALLKEHPQRDQIQTRWANHLGPALQEIGPGLGKDEVNMASTLPGWVQHQIDK